MHRAHGEHDPHDRRVAQRREQHNRRERRRVEHLQRRRERERVRVQLEPLARLTARRALVARRRSRAIAIAVAAIVVDAVAELTGWQLFRERGYREAHSTMNQNMHMNQKAQPVANLQQQSLETYQTHLQKWA